MDVRKVVIGVDVGGTNTDAVIVDNTTDDLKVISKAKTATTSDVTTGVKNAVRLALYNCRKISSSLAVQQVNIGTTHFVNALVEGKGLAQVAVIRLCGTSSLALPPFSDFPDNLLDTVKGSIFLVNGGYQVDGSLITELEDKEIEKCLCKLKENGEKHVVVSGIFSPVRPEQELKVLQIIEKSHPDMSVTMSHMVGQLGLLERENAAILNECIKPLASETVHGFRQALNEIGLKCPLYLTQYDGTIVNEIKALELPVHIFGSGPINSMRGASFLSGLRDAVVVDIGGTSTDVGLLVKGVPREASSIVTLVGIRTNLHLPDVISVGIGGGSYVTTLLTEIGNVKVGPLSAGYKLDREALVFSSNGKKSDRLITATDIAVAAGIADVGTKENVNDIDKTLVVNAMDTIHDALSECIDQMLNTDKPLVLVGGGSILVDKTKTFKGISEIISPDHFDVANAVGAALSQVSATIDRTVDLQNMIDNVEVERKIEEVLRPMEDANDDKKTSVKESTRIQCIQRARDQAVSEAIETARNDVVEFGGKPQTVYLAEKYDVIVSYAARIKVKMVAEFQSPVVTEIFQIPDWRVHMIVEEDADKRKQTTTSMGTELELNETIIVKKPHINENGEWLLSRYDIECLYVGTGIMGCGGGGTPRIGRLLLLKSLEEGNNIRIVTPSKLLKNADEENDLVVIVAYVGAPLVFYEKLVAGTETTAALQCMQDIYRKGMYHDKQLGEMEGVTVESAEGISYIENYTKTDETSNTDIGEKKIVALMSVEIGGFNSLEPLVVGATLGLPVLDCDCMGRSFPEIQMLSPFIYGCNPYPATLAGDQGRRAVVLYADGAKRLEDHFREITTSMGGSSGIVLSHFNKHEILNYTIMHSMSHAWRVGDAVWKARAENQSPVDAVVKLDNAKYIITGKITNVLHETSGGFNTGTINIEGIHDYTGQRILIEFQNEIIVAKLLTDDSVEILSCAPDLITMMDSHTAHPIMTEEARTGMRVSIVAIAAAPLMSTDQALKFVGPQAFGYPEDVYKRTSKYVDHPPVAPL